METRIIDGAQFEIREDDDGVKSLEGYAALYNEPTFLDLDETVRETIKPGAFDNSLKDKPDVVARVQHEGGLSVIGRTRNGSLSLTSDAKGLRYRVSPLPDTQAARDVHTLVRDGLITQSSFAFSPRGTEGQTVTREANGMVNIELVDINVHDVAPVSNPAYTGTSVEARSGYVAAALKKLPAPEPEVSDSDRRRMEMAQEMAERT